MQALYTSRHDYHFGLIREVIDLPFRDASRYLQAGQCWLPRFISDSSLRLAENLVLNKKERFLHLMTGAMLLTPVVNIAVRSLLKCTVKKVNHHPRELQMIKDPATAKRKIDNALKMASKHANEKPFVVPSFIQPFIFAKSPAVQTIKVGTINVGMAEVCGRRPTMEDAHIATTFKFKGADGKLEEASLFGVFDGHGGNGASHFIANYLTNYIKKELEKGSLLNKPLDDVFMMNALRQTMVKLDQDYDGDAGSTANLTLKMPNGDLWVANCGDSRSVLKNGHSAWPFFGYSVVPLSFDAKPAITKFMQKVIKRDGFVIKMNPPRVNGILAVAGAIGDNQIVNKLGQKCISPKPQVVKFENQKISKNSHLIIACDGFWDVFSSREAIALIKKLKDSGMNETEIANRLVQVAFERGSMDNISVMIIPLK